MVNHNPYPKVGAAAIKMSPGAIFDWPRESKVTFVYFCLLLDLIELWQHVIMP